jgi:hypothetical protein
MLISLINAHYSLLQWKFSPSYIKNVTTIVSQTSNYTIPIVYPSDAGVYTCTARTDHGTGQASVTLLEKLGDKDEDEEEEEEGEGEKKGGQSGPKGDNFPHKIIFIVVGSVLLVTLIVLLVIMVVRTYRTVDKRTTGRVFFTVIYSLFVII